MGLIRYLQHWLGGAGPRLQVADFVPDTHPLRNLLVILLAGTLQ